MFEIRVELPDVSSASDLKSRLERLEARCAVVSTESAHCVVVEPQGSTHAVLTSIRDWSETNGLRNVSVDMGGTHYSLPALSSGEQPGLRPQPGALTVSSNDAV